MENLTLEYVLRDESINNIVKDILNEKILNWATIEQTRIILQQCMNNNNIDYNILSKEEIDEIYLRNEDIYLYEALNDITLFSKEDICNILINKCIIVKEERRHYMNLEFTELYYILNQHNINIFHEYYLSIKNDVINEETSYYYYEKFINSEYITDIYYYYETLLREQGFSSIKIESLIKSQKKIMQTVSGHRMDIVSIYDIPEIRNYMDTMEFMTNNQYMFK